MLKKYEQETKDIEEDRQAIPLENYAKFRDESRQTIDKMKQNIEDYPIKDILSMIDQLDSNIKQITLDEV